MTTRRREALAAASGVLLALSFPKFGHSAVAWFALAPLLAAIPGSSGWLALRLGYVTGAVSALGLLYWTSITVNQFGGLSGPMAALVMTLLCLAVALFPAVFAWTTAAWCRADGPRALLLAPVAWVATEVLRAYTMLRFPWLLLGYSQHDRPALIQFASVTAVYGVSALVALVSSALGYAAHARGRRGGLAVAAAAGAVGLAALHGSWALRQPVETSGRVRVGLVQASVRQDQKWSERAYLDNVMRHVALTRRAAGEGARLVVWPESAVPYLFDRDPGIADLLRGLAADTGAFLLFGNDDRDERASFVGAKLLHPDGRLLLRYHKMRLVPFGEYVPLQPLLTLGGRQAAKFVRNVADFTPGDDPAVVTAAGGPLSVSICYEAIFPDLMRRFTARGAQLLVNVTNDGWYGRTSAPHQHLSMAVFRAVENRRWLVRDANTGISAIVDPRGRIVARTELFEERALVGDVPFVTGETFYVRYGDVFAWSAFALAVALTLRARRAGGQPT